MNLRWDARVLQDLRAIRSYIAARGSPAAADRVRQHLRNRVNRLLTNPFIGVVTTNPQIRILPPTRYGKRRRDPPHTSYRTIDTGGFGLVGDHRHAGSASVTVCRRAAWTI
jgi:plasmid stabilization system protein ParE